jgi:hypothetical protein
MPRDTSWGHDCETCGTRLNAEQAQRADAKAGDGPLMCGSCRDEDRFARQIADLRAENERLRLIADTQGAEVDRLRDELSTRSGQLREAVEERDEAIRLLANATDPANVGDWVEAREVGWEWARHRDPLGGQ